MWGGSGTQRARIPAVLQAERPCEPLLVPGRPERRKVEALKGTLPPTSRTEIACTQKKKWSAQHITDPCALPPALRGHLPSTQAWRSGTQETVLRNTAQPPGARLRPPLRGHLDALGRDILIHCVFVLQHSLFLRWHLHCAATLATMPKWTPATALTSVTVAPRAIVVGNPRAVHVGCSGSSYDTTMATEQEEQPDNRGQGGHEEDDRDPIFRRRCDLALHVTVQQPALLFLHTVRRCTQHHAALCGL